MDQEDEGSSFIDRYKLPILMGLVGGVLLISGVISSGLISKLFTHSEQSIKGTSIVKNPGLVKVDVSGAVLSPGVYSLSSEARIEDAIKAAGGVTTDVDGKYLEKSLNLAQKLTDGMKIYIPKVGDSLQTSVAGSSASVAPGSINLNSASLKDLDQLPGVGPVGAQAIIDHRPYSLVDELLSKKVVTKSVYEKIKDLVSI